MSYTHRSLIRLPEDIDAHRLLFPYIQRPFVWKRKHIRVGVACHVFRMYAGDLWDVG